MDFLMALWLPIVLSAVFVFVVSSIFHMAIPIHKGDHKKLPSEDKILDAMRAAGVTPATYMFPGADSLKEAGTPEMKKKFERGPIGLVTIMPPGSYNMGKSLMLLFLFCLLVGIFVAYAAWHGVSRGSEYLTVFRMAGVVAVVGYSLTHVVDSIWKGQSWGITAKFVFEGVVYGLVTAGTFAWLWPDAAA